MTRLLAPLAPEFRLLCLAVRPRVDTGALARAVAARPDWNLVIRGARRHRVTALALAGLGGVGVPPEVMAELRRQSTAGARRALGQAAELARLAHIFDAAGLRLMTLKGVVLAQQLYGDVAARGVGDMDLLVAPEDLWRAVDVLEGLGYALEGPRHGGRLLKEVTLHKPPHAVELHQRLMLNPHRLPLDFDALWRDRVEVGLAGTRLAALPERVQPLYLCLHGAHHIWERLQWLCDLARLLGDGAGVGAAREEARRWRLEPSMDLALALCADWLGLEAPVAEQARHERFVTRFFGGPRWLEAPPRGSWAWLRREMWRRLHLYGLKSGWHHLWQELAADLTNPVDRAVLPLPDRLAWLYPPLRPLGWVLRNWRHRRQFRGPHPP